MPIGKGLFGGPGGTYGKYNVGVNSNLSSQFQGAPSVEDQKLRRFKRKHESGYVGTGFWFANYPYIYGTMGTGGYETATHERGETPEQETAKQHNDETMGSATNGITTTGTAGATSDGSGMGGTATGVTGGLGS